jgi:hypothetical protein
MSQAMSEAAMSAPAMSQAMSEAPAMSQAMSEAMSGGAMSGGGGGAMSGGGGAMSAAMSGGAMSGGGMSGDPLRTGMSVNPRQAPRTRDFGNELSAIRTASGQIAQDQANAVVDTAGRLSDQAIENTGDIAQRLEDSTYTAAANQNVRDAGTSATQLGQSYNQVGQVAERAAAFADPVKDRLNQMAMGQLYRPDQISSQNVAADQVSGARVANVGQMDYARLGQVANVQGPAGYAADQVQAQRIDAAQAGPVDNVSSNNIRASAAERGLMREARGGGLLGQLEGQAANDLALGRSLSAEQSRDATQSARAAASARGLGLGQSAMAAELLNRDRFATQRETERRTFAGNVAQQGVGIRQAANQAYMGRQDANAGRTLQADLANQSAGLNLGQTNAQLLQQSRLANQSAGLQAQQNNQSANARALEFAQQGGLQASMANQQAGLSQASEQARLQQTAIGATYDASQQRAMADAGYAQQAALSNQDANLRAAQYNSGQNLAAQQANQSANYNANYAKQNFLQGVASQNFNQFSGQQSMLGSLYGQQAGIAQNQYANNLGLAQAQVALDPYQRALGSNIPIASQGNAASMIGQAYGNSMNYGSDLFNTNTNMQASIYNSYMNNQAALQGARLQAGATAGAGNSAMIGGIASGAGALIGGIAGSFIAPGIGTGIGASLGGSLGGMAGRACWVARAAWGEDNPRWIEFRDSMLTHAPEWFVAAYMQHGQSLARHINTPARRALARLVLSTLQHLWTPAKSTLQPA